ncbi:MAG: DUF190 domain-containing protein [Rivularia sp. (in: Bacteria)]|nr:DUF190 domain-containing protein [Rivularia sp. MS3]
MTTWEQLTIYTEESDRWHGKALYVAIIERAKQQGLTGATATRGIIGFGKHGRIHTTEILALSSDLPIVVTLIARFEQIEEFLPVVQEMVKEGIIVRQTVGVIHSSL